MSSTCLHNSSGAYAPRYFRDRRVELGLSKAELARRAGISLSTIYGIEDGIKQDVYVGTVRKLARALETTVARLLGVG